MTREQLVHIARSFVERDESNRIAPDIALRPDLAGLRMYDAPLVRVCAAGDPLFHGLTRPEAIGEHFLPPERWLPGAASVVSLFIPLSRAVREGNARSMDWPDDAWLHARIEGQTLIDRLTARLRDALIAAGHAAIAPSLDERFATGTFTSNWSERHAAYICGLGTFGLSKGLISEQGVAGRYTSVVTSLRLPADPRPYTGLYDHCSRCGACARNCPAGAIDIETGKDHAICSAFLDRVMDKHRPRYGCGKCQVRVPCETRPCPRKT